MLPDNSLAVRAFQVSLFFWVPVINLFVVPVTLLFAIVSLIRSSHQPKRYGGRGYAIAAITLCCVGIGVLLYSIFELGIADVLATNAAQKPLESSLLIYILGGMLAELLILITLQSLGAIRYVEHQARRDTLASTTAFILALVSWVPLFNLFSNPLALYFAGRSLYLQYKEPQTYGGLKRAISALVISIVWIFLFFYSLAVFGPEILFKR